ncbi:MAG: glycosyltransferase family 92 protein, partial [Solirubrobacterales bacterium]
AYDHCLMAHRTDSRWIAFIDADEFLFSPQLRPLPGVLRDYEGFPAVGVNRATFGTSGHRTRPAGLLIDSYLRRGGRNRFMKSIVQPSTAIRCLSAHRFEYRYRLAVDENGYPIHRDATKSVSFERLRINHYYTKSEAELREKLSAARPDYGQARAGSWEIVKGQFNDEHDDLISAYGSQVRAALEGRRGARPPAGA